MPINIPNNLPAYSTLVRENIFVISQDRAMSQDIRPLSIAILNLMPTKIETETQLLRLLSNSPLQIDITLLQTATYSSKNTSPEHLLSFYTTFETVKERYFDALIITGAPVEHMEFEDVNYWPEIVEIMEWSKSHVYSTIHICWGAQAGLFYHYGIKKYKLDKKMFGVFPHKLMVENHPLLKGFDEIFYMPHSRHTDVSCNDIVNHPKLSLLAYSDIAGVGIISDITNRQFFITGHNEYDYDTLKNEYFRDLNKGLEIDIPYNYFPNNDVTQKPLYSWRGHGSLMYSNWLNFCVYQETPYDITKIPPLE